MIAPLPLSQNYNLGRLGSAGDEVRLEADAAARQAIAAWAEVEAVEKFIVTASLTKPAPTRYAIRFVLEADVVQACVATLAPVPGHIVRDFVRELDFIGAPRRGARDEEPALPVAALGGILEEGPEPPERIESLHYDLAAPALEEFVLALDPYPRAPGASFDAPDDGSVAPENPFAVLKGLKSRP